MLNQICLLLLLPAVEVEHLLRVLRLGDVSEAGAAPRRRQAHRELGDAGGRVLGRVLPVRVADVTHIVRLLRNRCVLVCVKPRIPGTYQSLKW